MTVQDDFARGHGQGDDGEAGRSPVISDDVGASDGDRAPDGEGAGSGFGSEDDGPWEREAKLPPAPGFSPPDDVELLVRTSSSAASIVRVWVLRFGVWRTCRRCRASHRHHPEGVSCCRRASRSGRSAAKKRGRRWQRQRLRCWQTRRVTWRSFACWTPLRPMPIPWCSPPPAWHDLVACLYYSQHTP